MARQSPLTMVTTSTPRVRRMATLALTPRGWEPTTEGSAWNYALVVPLEPIPTPTKQWCGTVACNCLAATDYGEGGPMRFAEFAPMLALVTIDASACASRGAPVGSGVPSMAQEAEQMVTVQNDNWLDVVVYVVNGSARARVGTVGGLSSATFRVKGGLMSTTPARLLIDPIGTSRGYLTDAITVMPGQQIELRVGSQLSLSTVLTR